MSEIAKETLEQWRKLTIRPESTGLDCLRLMNIKDALINALESLQQENRYLRNALDLIASDNSWRVVACEREWIGSSHLTDQAFARSILSALLPREKRESTL